MFRMLWHQNTETLDIGCIAFLFAYFVVFRYMGSIKIE